MNTRRKPAYYFLLFARSAAISVAIAVLALYFLQDIMIYHPQRYDGNPSRANAADRPIVQLHYKTSEGDQTAFYIPPAHGRTRNRLWVMFGGNGARVLDYADDLPAEPAVADDAFLMIDYPGYGYNAGRPSSAAIAESANKALSTLASQLHESVPTLLNRSGVFGHSLGTGVSLEFACAHPQVSRVVLVAPFTSLYDMANRTVGPGAILLRHNYNNAGNLHKLSLRQPRPIVAIFHGDQDEVIPVQMSRTLAAENPWLTYHEVKGCDHNDIVVRASGEIAGVVAGMDR